MHGMQCCTYIQSCDISLMSCDSIPAERQRLRSGFPPKELKPGSDPAHPLELTNGERVSVDIIETKQDTPPPKPKVTHEKVREEEKEEMEEAGKSMSTSL